MAKTDKFIIRVDDVGQLPDQSKPDRGLEYFFSWFKAGAWDRVPMYLGVVPADLTDDEIKTLYDHTDKHGGEVCIHGWDHAHEVLSREAITKAADKLSIGGSVRCVIPPFNKYDEATVKAMWDLLGKDAVLFGGLEEDRRVLNVGDTPTVVNGVLHLPADELLYGHSYKLRATVTESSQRPFPRVVTLHHRWDHADVKQCRAVRDAVHGRTVTVDHAWTWTRNRG
jgi:hypothetical protein